MTAVVKRVRDEALPVLVITISIGLYALFICNKTMPVSEGWYSEYAALINRGYVPYRDFDLIFPLFTLSLSHGLPVFLAIRLYAYAI